MSVCALVGAGGHGRVVLAIWRAAEPSALFAFLDDSPQLLGQKLDGVAVHGPIASLQTWQGPALLAIGNNPVRLALAERWSHCATWAKVVHPSAAVLASARIDPGALVCAGAVVNAGAHVGAHAIVNSGAIVEHDCVLEEGVSVSPGACMGGRVHLGRGAFVSVGVTIAPRVRIGAGTVVGAGAVVVSDLPAGVLAYGAPARPVRQLGSDFDWRRLL